MSLNAFLLTVLLILAARPAAAQSSLAIALDDLLERAAQYVADFEAGYSRLVAEERYVQQLTRSRELKPIPGRQSFEVQGPGPQRRELRSDFLLVKLPGEDRWIPFRDVFEVDGRLVRDREERLARLFLQPVQDVLEQARQIMADSTRYNIGEVNRTLNLPILALEILRESEQSRFRFSNLRPDRDLGAAVYAVQFEEQMGPTLVQGLSGRDLFARGHFWIDSTNGQVVKSELLIDHPSIVTPGENGGPPLRRPAIMAMLTTVYRNDPAYSVAVPIEMREDYRFEDAGGARVTGLATYGRFRTFGVQVDDTVVLPK